MVAYKAAQTARFLKHPESQFRAFLLYGPDAGLVSDRGAALAQKLVSTSEPEAEVIRLDERDLAQEPDRLAIEARTLSMFAGTKVVQVRGGSGLETALAELIDTPMEAHLIVEAGNLRPSSKLRKLFEAARQAVTLPCYSDAARDLGPLIDEELAKTGVAIATDAKADLVALLGSDMALARSEIAKLALYAGKDRTIEAADVEAVVGDSSDVALDALAEAVADGAAERVLNQFDRLAAAGTGAQAGLTALGRYFGRLHRVVISLEAGGNAKSAIAGLRPPPSFKQRDALTRQASRWNRMALQTAIDAIQNTTAQTRRRPELERALTERALLMICQMSR